MLYLATASGPQVRDAMATGLLGQMVTPDAGNRVVDGTRWAIDNGCFAARWTPERWLATLDRHQHLAADCLFVVVPDVVADAQATNERWARWHGAARNRGYRTAYVLQNGATSFPPCSAVFIGGDTPWKLGVEARALVAEAKARGLWVHMGRVNSLRRLRYAAALGCDSVDGTFLAFGPDHNLPQLLRWLRWAHEPTLFEGAS